MPAMKTPGVYIVEKSAFPNSVVEVATAVPAFIGHTQVAMNGSKSLTNKPWRITSMAEYHQYYGFAPEPLFNIRDATEDEEASFTVRVTDELGASTIKDKFVVQTSQKYTLYYNMRMFFQNGGGPCYIVSVADYETDFEPMLLSEGINTLEKEQEPTMVVIPEAVSLKESANCKSVQEAMLKHCAYKMRNRIAILDVYNGAYARQTTEIEGNCIDDFRDYIGINYLDFGVAYYPWVNTTIVQDSELSFDIFESKEDLINILVDEVNSDGPTQDAAVQVQRDAFTEEINKIKDKVDENTLNDDDKAAQRSERALLNKTLSTISPLYVEIIKSIKLKLNELPPSAAMAGIYTMVDNTRGVWKSPANVSMAGVVSPTVNITHDEQEDLNVTSQGKSINAIRSFIGEGTLVWGARTLDGNSLDWRYISVRRTMIMLEESIRLSSKAYVFDANTAQTWVTIKSMIRNFLTGIWKRGGLAGSSPEDAFSVHVGLGETMTPEDILEGILRVSVFVAVTRPAEFIEITFTQQMQKS